MMQDFTNLLVSVGMNWKAGSLQILHTGSVANECCFSLLQHEQPMPVEAVETMELLGGVLSNRGDSLPL